MDIRDNREKEWFWLDNEYLNGYAKYLGSTASLVYISLCRHSNNDNQTCFPSMELIADELGMQRSAISRALKKLSQWNIILIKEEYDSQSKKRKNNVYTLLNKRSWRSKPCNNKLHGSHVTIKNKPCNNKDESHVTQSYSNKTQLTTLTQQEDVCEDKTEEVIKAIFKVKRKRVGEIEIGLFKQRYAKDLSTLVEFPKSEVMEQAKRLQSDGPSTWGTGLLLARLLNS